MNNRVITRINNILTAQLMVAISDIKPEGSLMDDMGADSLDIVELVMAIEEEFNFDIPDEDCFQKPCTVGKIYEYVEGRVLE